ncbi:MAG: twin-arginine translocase subunit TatB [Geminicoccaceae bacterium]|nr:MAG: twin-arginine translocase subunit TatB [Geminicoccaceae bacterium]
MFDLGWAEMGIIMLVALLVLGPKELPRLARDIGRWTGKARAMAREFQRSLEDIAREAELDEVKKQIEQASRFDAGKQIEKTIDPDGTLKRAFEPPRVNPAPKPPAQSAGQSAPQSPVQPAAAAELPAPPPPPASEPAAAEPVAANAEKR